MTLLLMAALALPAGCSSQVPSGEAEKGTKEYRPPKSPNAQEEESSTEEETLDGFSDGFSHKDPWSVIEQPVALDAVYVGLPEEGHRLTKEDFQVTGYFADGHTGKWDGWNSDSLGTILGAGNQKVRIRCGSDAETIVNISCRESALPRFDITTLGGEEIDSKAEYVRATLSFYPGEGNEWEAINEQTVFVRGRGTSTFQMPKTPYQVNFTERTSLFGLPEAKKWVFLANYSDKTLMRNRVGLEMARSLGMKYVPTTCYAEVYVNGEYCGIYSVGDKIEEDPVRVDLPYSEDPVETGYLLDMGKIDRYYFSLNPGLKQVGLDWPSGEKLTDEHRAYIRKIVADLDTAIRKGGDYASRIDVDSFIDWWIVTELSFNTDCCFHRSCFMVVEPGGKLSLGPVWDFDLAFGNFTGDLDRYDTFVTVGSKDGSTYVAENWFNFLLQDPAFCKKLQERWDQVGDELCRNSEKMIREDQKLLTGPSEKNFQKYDVMGICLDYCPPNSVALDTYEKNVDALVQFIEDRHDWMDEAIRNLPLIPEPEEESIQATEEESPEETGAQND